MLRLDLTEAEADDLLSLIKWAKGQTYYLLTDTAKKNHAGNALRVAAMKLAVATNCPDWEN